MKRIKIIGDMPGLNGWQAVEKADGEEIEIHVRPEDVERAKRIFAPGVDMESVDWWAGP